MTVPWSRLGLARFVLVTDNTEVVYDEGVPAPELSAEDISPHLSYRETAVDAPTVVHLRQLAQILLPSLSDHRLSALADAFAASSGDDVSEVAYAVLIGLLRLAMSYDPRVSRSLARCVGGATGDLLERCALEGGTTPLTDHQETSAEATPPNEDTPPARLEDATSLFLPGGVMETQIDSYEHRPAQEEMAQDVGTVLQDGGTLLIEAGAGTGKTFAYIVPLLLYLSDRTSARAVVSTRTRHLQDQLYEKDLPRLISTFAPGLRCALLKGRENYLCIRRWNQFQQERPLPLDALPDRKGAAQRSSDEDLAVASLTSWLAITRTGDIEENAVFQSLPEHRQLWARLRDDPLHCPASACSHYEECFSFRARRAARAARLVVANHSLVMSDLAAAGRLLGPYEVLVTDEAHSLEAATRDAFTYTLTRTVVERLLRDLEAGSGRRRTGWIPGAARSLDTAQVKALRQQCKTIDQGNRELFAQLDKALPQAVQDRSPVLDDLARPAQAVAEQLRLLSRLVVTAAESIDDAESVREAELLSAATEEAASVLLHLLVAPRSSDEVYWYERLPGRLALHASPIEVGPILERTLYPKLDSLILTSATLAPSQRFTYIRQSLGLKGSPQPMTQKIVLGSFDYARRMAALEARFVPSVRSQSDYADAISDLLVKLHTTVPRNTLVLFTSNQMLNEVRTRLPKSLPVLAQGTHGSKQGITHRFRQQSHAILLATGSFWEGIDLPGRQLEVLVITRLPFSVPSEPIFAAQAERAEKQGRDPFLDLSLPLAVLRFRQGIGRLIRTEDDAGTVIITDTRISQRRYGAAFRESLPVPPLPADTTEDIANRIAERFSKGTRPIDRSAQSG